VNPAYSIILFTTASGAGYGLLAMMGFFAAGELAPATRWFGLAGLLVAFAGISFGLFASALRLGHPERAWRTISQWRSSWLSRQAVCTIGACVPGLLFAVGWVVSEDYTGVWRMLGVIAALFSILAVYCTGMMFATLRPVIAWSNRHTVRLFLAMAAWTGALWFNLLTHLFGAGHPIIAMVVLASGFLAFLMKRRHWRFIDTSKSPATPETATGLHGLGDVRLLDAPHTNANYVQREMGYRIARAHAFRLRRFAFLAAFPVPWAIVLGTMESDYGVAVPAALVAVISGMIGALCERWLFFAEAKHAAALYYGETEV